MAALLRLKRRLRSSQIILLGFAGLILAGAVLLALPCAARSGRRTPFHEALFTAVSAVCVTGLVVQDTAAYWSGFGQGVILLLIQIGGMGVITVAACFSLLAGRRFSLVQSGVVQQALSAPRAGGIARLTGFVIKTALTVELLGALLLMPAFCRDHGAAGVWMAVFHAVSAFCNAGFDLMGTARAPYASLTAYRADPVVNGTVMLLIISGGIGFLTWDDIRAHGLRLRRYRMQSKAILAATGVLLAGPAAYFFLFEFADLPLGERALLSLFQAVTPRTAGFNTADLTRLTGPGQGLVTVLMLLGGAPGSTAGGMKITTAAVLLACVRAALRRRPGAQCFGRRLAPEAVCDAAAVFVTYLALFFCGGLTLSLTEGLPLGPCLFEAASALGTVGLSLGLTPTLGLAGRAVLMGLMFFGRVGALTFLYAAFPAGDWAPSLLPQETIAVG